MSKHDPATLRKILSIILSRPNLANAARLVQISEVTLHDWVKKSRNSDPRFLIDFPAGSPPQQFAELLVYCRRSSLIQFESQFRDECANGRRRILRNASTGEIVWEKDERYIGVSDDDMVLLGLDPVFHRIKRDAAGMPVAAVVYDPPSAHAQIKLLSSAVPGYADTKHVTLDAKVSGSVMRIPAPGQEAAKVIEHIVEAIAAPDDVTDEELLGDNPYVDPPEPEKPEVSPKERQDIKELQELAALSPDERRARYAQKMTPKPAHEVPYVRMEDRAEGLGRGGPPSGANAVKVV